jgi:hypothetical protein
MDPIFAAYLRDLMDAQAPVPKLNGRVLKKCGGSRKQFQI